MHYFIPGDMGANISILQKRKLKLQERKGLAYGHMAGEQVGSNLNLGLPFALPGPLPTREGGSPPCRGSCPPGAHRASRAVLRRAGCSGSSLCPPPQGTGGSCPAAGGLPVGGPGGSGDF